MSGPLTHSPADIARYALVGLGVGTLPESSGFWPVYESSEPSSPDNCVTVYNTDGIGEGRDQTDGEVQEHEGLQFRIRATDPRTGWAKAEAIKNAIDKGIYNTSVTIESSTYLIHAISRRGNIIDLGRDMANTDRKLFTINAIVALTQLS